MQDFAGKLAVVTGGGTGMGRALARHLTREGCAVAMCDVSAENMAETAALCRADAPEVAVSTFVADVSDEAQVLAFRDHVQTAHATDHVNLVFNNAGIGGGGGFVNGDRDEWERTFAVCWYGVYYGCRTFVPLLVASEEGHLVNTSSVNGFWATLGPQTSHTAYSAAKFAVKGFTESLVNDFRLNAPHVKVSVVMPGHIGTSIALNTSAVLGKHSALEMTAEEVDAMRTALAARGAPVDNVPDDHIRQMLHQRGIDFRDKAPTTAEQAAGIILDGVRAERWRILVGDDAEVLDELVRADPESAYEPSLIDKMRETGKWGILVQS